MWSAEKVQVDVLGGLPLFRWRLTNEDGDVLWSIGAATEDDGICYEVFEFEGRNGVSLRGLRLSRGRATDPPNPLAVLEIAAQLRWLQTERVQRGLRELSREEIDTLVSNLVEGVRMMPRSETRMDRFPPKEVRADLEGIS